MRAPAILLATLCILVGIFPALLVEPLVNSVTRASLMQPDFAGTSSCNLAWI